MVRTIPVSNRRVGTSYDSNTAVTFLMIGLGAGALMATLLAPRYRNGRIRDDSDGDTAKERAVVKTTFAERTQTFP